MKDIYVHRHLRRSTFKDVYFYRHLFRDLCRDIKDGMASLADMLSGPRYSIVASGHGRYYEGC